MPYSSRPNVCARNTPIWSRVTLAVGQYAPFPQPLTTPRRASSSIHLQNGLEAGTSLNISEPATQAGGLRFGSSVFSVKIDICSRVTGFCGQYRLGPQPPTTPRLASSSTKRQKGLVSGTSLKRLGGAQAGG